MTNGRVDLDITFSNVAVGETLAPNLIARLVNTDGTVNIDANSRFTVTQAAVVEGMNSVTLTLPDGAPGFSIANGEGLRFIVLETTDEEGVPFDFTIQAVRISFTQTPFEREGASFRGLSDTPNSYSSQGGMFVAVNSGADALEFVSAPTPSNTDINSISGINWPTANRPQINGHDVINADDATDYINKTLTPTQQSVTEQQAVAVRRSIGTSDFRCYSDLPATFGEIGTTTVVDVYLGGTTTHITLGLTSFGLIIPSGGNIRPDSVVRDGTDGRTGGTSTVPLIHQGWNRYTLTWGANARLQFGNATNTGAEPYEFLFTNIESDTHDSEAIIPYRRFVSEAGVTSITAGTGLDGGTITTSGTIDLADTAVTPGTYSDATVTVDQQGRITGILAGSGGNIAGVTSDATNVTEITWDNDFQMTTTPQVAGAITAGAQILSTQGGGTNNDFYGGNDAPAFAGILRIVDVIPGNRLNDQLVMVVTGSGNSGLATGNYLVNVASDGTAFFELDMIQDTDMAAVAPPASTILQLNSNFTFTLNELTTNEPTAASFDITTPDDSVYRFTNEGIRLDGSLIGEQTNPIVFSQDVGGIVNGPSASEVTNGEFLRADNTWHPVLNSADDVEALTLDFTGTRPQIGGVNIATTADAAGWDGSVSSPNGTHTWNFTVDNTTGNLTISNGTNQFVLLAGDDAGVQTTSGGFGINTSLDN